MKKLLILLPVLAAIQTQAATIENASGSLEIRYSDSIDINGYGSYQHASNVYSPSIISADIGPATIAISANANAYYYGDDEDFYVITPRVHGQIEFTLTKASDIRVDYFTYADSFTSQRPMESMFIQDESGKIVLECVGIQDYTRPSAAGCSNENTVFSSGKEGTFDFFLEGGVYILDVLVYSEVAFELPFSGQMDLSMDFSPVPIPAAAWLFMSGLGALRLLSSRAKPKNC